jgi:hypothetical protein
LHGENIKSIFKTIWCNQSINKIGQKMLHFLCPIKLALVAIFSMTQFTTPLALPFFHN